MTGYAPHDAATVTIDDEIATLDDIADLARMMDIDEEAIADLQREYLRQMHGGGPGLVGRIRARFRRD